LFLFCLRTCFFCNFVGTPPSRPHRPPFLPSKLYQKKLGIGGSIVFFVNNERAPRPAPNTPFARILPRLRMVFPAKGNGERCGPLFFPPHFQPKMGTIEWVATRTPPPPAAARSTSPPTVLSPPGRAFFFVFEIFCGSHQFRSQLFRVPPTNRL